MAFQKTTKMIKQFFGIEKYWKSMYFLTREPCCTGPSQAELLVIPLTFKLGHLVPLCTDQNSLNPDKSVLYNEALTNINKLMSSLRYNEKPLSYWALWEEDKKIVTIYWFQVFLFRICCRKIQWIQIPFEFLLSLIFEQGN